MHSKRENILRWTRWLTQLSFTTSNPSFTQSGKKTKQNINLKLKLLHNKSKKKKSVFSIEKKNQNKTKKTLPQSSSINNDVHYVVIHQIIPDASQFNAAVRSGLSDLTDNESELRLDWTTLFGSDSDCHLPDPAGEEIRADRLTDRSSHLQKMIYSKLSTCESPPKTMMYCIAITSFFHTLLFTP